MHGNAFRSAHEKEKLMRSFLKIAIVVFILFLSVLIFCSTSMAKVENIKAIRFNDGTILYGTVIEINSSIIKITTDDGKTITKKFDDVAELKSISTSQQIGAYVGLFGGSIFSPDIEIGTKKFALDTKNSWVAGLKVGYTFPEFKAFSIEFEYSYLKPYINRTVLIQSPDIVAIEGDAKLNNFMVNVLLKYPHGVIHPYFGGGAGASYVDFSYTASVNVSGANFVRNTGDHDLSMAWQLLAGIEVDLAKHWAGDIGYRYFATNPQFSETELDIKTSMLSLGIKYKF